MSCLQEESVGFDSPPDGGVSPLRHLFSFRYSSTKLSKIIDHWPQSSPGWLMLGSFAELVLSRTTASPISIRNCSSRWSSRNISTWRWVWVMSNSWSNDTILPVTGWHIENWSKHSSSLGDQKNNRNYRHGRWGCSGIRFQPTRGREGESFFPVCVLSMHISLHDCYHFREVDIPLTIVFIFMFSNIAAPWSQDDANQHDWISQRSPCERVYGWTLANAPFCHEQSFWNSGTTGGREEKGNPSEGNSGETTKNSTAARFGATTSSDIDTTVTIAVNHCLVFGTKWSEKWSSEDSFTSWFFYHSSYSYLFNSFILTTYIHYCWLENLPKAKSRKTFTKIKIKESWSQSKTQSWN